MSTGPQRFPGASTAYWYQDDYPGDAQEVNVVVLHTTEGRTLPDYNGGSVAPNLTALPDFAAKKLKWFQHFDFDCSSRALVNLSGGVETNTNNVAQVELVGTCDPATKAAWVNAGKRQDADFIYWPEAPDWALKGVAELLAWAHAGHAVPLSGPATWKAYPSSYGSSNGVRMSPGVWNAFKGVCGHMHVPENQHGDPGSIDFDRILELANGDTPAPPAPSTEESDMPSVLNKPNPSDAPLASGRWVELAFQTNGVIHAGPVVHQTMVHLLFDATTSPDTRIEGQFFLTDSAGNNPSDYLASDAAGPEGCQFHANGQVPAGKQLHFKVRATSPDGSDVTLLHRVASGLYWAA